MILIDVSRILWKYNYRGDKNNSKYLLKVKIKNAKVKKRMKISMILYHFKNGAESVSVFRYSLMREKRFK